MDVRAYFKEENETVYFTGVYMELYIPRYYFDDKVALRIGAEIETLGIFNFRIFDNIEGKGSVPLHVYNFPSMMMTKPTDSFNAKKPDLFPISGEEEYVVLRYYKGDQFIVSTNMIQKSDYTVNFINLMNKGKLPKIIPYDKILETEIANLDFNGVNLAVPGTAMELIISEINRDGKDLTKPFRYRAGAQGRVNMYEYKPINIKAIANQSSTFTGVTFEDIDYSILSSVNKFRSGVKEAESPIEKTIKY